MAPHASEYNRKKWHPKIDYSIDLGIVRPIVKFDICIKFIGMSKKKKVVICNNNKIYKHLFVFASFLDH